MSQPKFDLGAHVSQFLTQGARDKTIDEFVNRKSSRVSDPQHVLAALNRLIEKGRARAAADIALHYQSLLSSQDIDRFYILGRDQARQQGLLGEAYNLARRKNDPLGLIEIMGELSDKCPEEICNLIGIDATVCFLQKRNPGAVRALQEDHVKKTASSDLVSAVRIAKSMSPPLPLGPVVDAYLRDHYFTLCGQTIQEPLRDPMRCVREAGVEDEAREFLRREGRLVELLMFYRESETRSEEEEALAREIVDTYDGRDYYRTSVWGQVEGIFDDREKDSQKERAFRNGFRHQDQQGNFNKAYSLLAKIDSEGAVTYARSVIQREGMDKEKLHALGRAIENSIGHVQSVDAKGIEIRENQIKIAAESFLASGEGVPAYQIARTLSQDYASDIYIRALIIAENALDFHAAETIAHLATDTTRERLYATCHHYL